MLHDYPNTYILSYLFLYDTLLEIELVGQIEWRLKILKDKAKFLSKVVVAIYTPHQKYVKEPLNHTIANTKYY